MDWLTIVCTPLLTLLGIIVTEQVKLKTKKMELLTVKDSSIAECQTKHAANLDKVKGEFNTRLDEISDSLFAIKEEQLKLSLTVSQLQKDVVKHNEVIERTYKLEKEVEVLKNRESVSEHRLTDLEKENKV